MMKTAVTVINLSHSQFNDYDEPETDLKIQCVPRGKHTLTQL